jgi:hypothetical protein
MSRSLKPGRVSEAESFRLPRSTQASRTGYRDQMFGPRRVRIFRISIQFCRGRAGQLVIVVCGILYAVVSKSHLLHRDGAFRRRSERPSPPLLMRRRPKALRCPTLFQGMSGGPPKIRRGRQSRREKPLLRRTSIRDARMEHVILLRLAVVQPMMISDVGGPETFSGKLGLPSWNIGNDSGLGRKRFEAGRRRSITMLPKHPAIATVASANLTASQRLMKIDSTARPGNCIYRTESILCASTGIPLLFYARCRQAP